jgi:hypothetical protein
MSVVQVRFQPEGLHGVNAEDARGAAGRPYLFWPLVRERARLFSDREQAQAANIAIASQTGSAGIFEAAEAPFSCGWTLRR